MTKSLQKDTNKSSILVVDDTPATVELLERNLRTRGYRVHTALNVHQAIRILKAAPIDLVITDLRMPGAGWIWSALSAKTSKTRK